MESALQSHMLECPLLCGLVSQVNSPYQMAGNNHMNPAMTNHQVELDVSQHQGESAYEAYQHQVDHQPHIQPVDDLHEMAYESHCQLLDLEPYSQLEALDLPESCPTPSLYDPELSQMKYDDVPTPTDTAAGIEDQLDIEAMPMTWF